ncbi:MAG: cytochrome c oxidase assembly factor Coa1 family protein [Candidatus Methylacidiphilales bacterium]|nr:cytochrome c oxidase assembly factor Coa1 family protein [Candidatus Methylacidiphilales bacterium]
MNTTSSYTNEQSVKKPQDLKWVIIAVPCALVAAFLVFVLITLLMQQLDTQVNGIYNNVHTKLISSLASTQLNRNSEAVKLLGENIQASEIPGQRLEYDVTSKVAAGKLNVKGTKAHGTLTVSRQKGNGKDAMFQVLQLEVDGKVYDLLKIGNAENMPPTPG